MTDYRVIVIPNDIPKFSGLKTFTFEFNNQPVLLGLSEDYLNLFQIVQIGSTDTKNSWFFGNTVIKDGRMFGILPVLKGWIFLSLFSKCSQAQSVFLTIDDMLSALYDNSNQDPVLLERISAIFKTNRSEIEDFLSIIMPSQLNLENDLGFRYEESKAADNIYQIVSKQVLDESDMPTDLKYFELKWSSNSENISTVILLDNLQFFLPSNLFLSICSRFALYPSNPEDLNKRIKLSESMLLKPIKSSKDADVSLIAPTDDYTKFESKLKPEKPKNSKFAVTGNTSMLSFFKKATN